MQSDDYDLCWLIEGASIETIEYWDQGVTLHKTDSHLNLPHVEAMFVERKPYFFFFLWFLFEDE